MSIYSIWKDFQPNGQQKQKMIKMIKNKLTPLSQTKKYPMGKNSFQNFKNLQKVPKLKKQPINHKSRKSITQDVIMNALMNRQLCRTQKQISQQIYEKPERWMKLWKKTGDQFQNEYLTARVYNDEKLIFPQQTLYPMDFRLKLRYRSSQHNNLRKLTKSVLKKVQIFRQGKARQIQQRKNIKQKNKQKINSKLKLQKQKQKQKQKIKQSMVQSNVNNDKNIQLQDEYDQSQQDNDLFLTSNINHNYLSQIQYNQQNQQIQQINTPQQNQICQQQNINDKSKQQNIYKYNTSQQQPRIPLLYPKISIMSNPKISIQSSPKISIQSSPKISILQNPIIQQISNKNRKDDWIYFITKFIFEQHSGKSQEYKFYQQFTTRKQQNKLKCFIGLFENNKKSLRSCHANINNHNSISQKQNLQRSYEQQRKLKDMLQNKTRLAYTNRMNNQQKQNEVVGFTNPAVKLRRLRSICNNVQNGVNKVNRDKASQKRNNMSYSCSKLRMNSNHKKIIQVNKTISNNNKNNNK